MDIEDGIELGLGLGVGAQFGKVLSRAIISDTIICFYCESKIGKKSKYCSDCGKSLIPPSCKCCNHNNPLGSKFCNECGEKI